MENKKNLNEIKISIKQILIDALQLENTSIDDINDEMPFFGTDDEPGLIQDSLAVLEISTRIADLYDIMPSDFNQENFVNVNSVSDVIFLHLNKETEN